MTGSQGFQNLINALLVQARLTRSINEYLINVLNSIQQPENVGRGVEVPDMMNDSVPGTADILTDEGQRERNVDGGLGVPDMMNDQWQF